MTKRLDPTVPYKPHPPPPGRPFPKGVSPNPGGVPKGGRPKVTRSMQELARDFGPEGIEILKEIARNKRTPSAQRVAAVQVLLDRGYGRAALQDGEALVQITNNVNQMVVSPAQQEDLRRRAAEAIATAFSELPAPVEIEAIALPYIPEPPEPTPTEVEAPPPTVPVGEAVKVIAPVELLTRRQQLLRDPEYRRRHSLDSSGRKISKGYY